MAIVEYYDNIISPFSGAIVNSKQIIPVSQYRARLSPEIRNLYDQYPSLNILTQFIRMSWRYAKYFPDSTRVSVARIGKSCKKILGGIHYEIDSLNNIIVDTYIGELQIFTNTLVWWMLNHQHFATKTSVTDGGAVIELTPVAFSALDDIESWQLVENIIYNNIYDIPFNLDHKLSSLLTGITFIASADIG